MMDARLPRCDSHVNIRLDRVGRTTLGGHSRTLAHADVCYSLGGRGRLGDGYPVAAEHDHQVAEIGVHRHEERAVYLRSCGAELDHACEPARESLNPGDLAIPDHDRPKQKLQRSPHSQCEAVVSHLDSREWPSEARPHSWFVYTPQRESADERNLSQIPVRLQANSYPVTACRERNGQRNRAGQATGVTSSLGWQAPDGAIDVRGHSRTLAQARTLLTA